MKKILSIILVGVMLFSALPFASGAAAGASFADLEAGWYYLDAVAWAVERKITTGTTPTGYLPLARGRRAPAQRTEQSLHRRSQGRLLL